MGPFLTRAIFHRLQEWAYGGQAFNLQRYRRSPLTAWLGVRLCRFRRRACQSAGSLLISFFARLAFLSPRIVEAIVAGRQPPELTAKALTERVELPLLWSEQEQAVGII